MTTVTQNQKALTKVAAQKSPRNMGLKMLIQASASAETEEPLKYVSLLAEQFSGQKGKKSASAETSDGDFAEGEMPETPATLTTRSLSNSELMTPTSDNAGHFMPPPATPKAKSHALFATSATQKHAHGFLAVMTAVAQFLPFADVQRLRATGHRFAEVAAQVAPMPVPDLGPQATFVYWTPSAEKLALRAEKGLEMGGRHAEKAITNGPNGQKGLFWRCLSCNLVTTGHRACAYCHRSLAQAACRVFVGQLRKEHTADLVRHIFSMLMPEVNIMHVESHTNGNDGRGKGCAWVYLSSPEEAIAALAYNRRIFIDHDGTGSQKSNPSPTGEGYWVVEENLTPQLQNVAMTCSAMPNRPIVLPKQLLVCELPSSSMMHEYIASMNQWNQSHHPSQMQAYPGPHPSVKVGQSHTPTYGTKTGYDAAGYPKQQYYNGGAYEGHAHVEAQPSAYDNRPAGGQYVDGCWYPEDAAPQNPPPYTSGAPAGRRQYNPYAAQVIPQ